MMANFVHEQFMQERFFSGAYWGNHIADEVVLPWGERKVTGMISNEKRQRP